MEDPRKHWHDMSLVHCVCTTPAGPLSVRACNHRINTQLSTNHESPAAQATLLHRLPRPNIKTTYSKDVLRLRYHPIKPQGCTLPFLQKCPVLLASQASMKCFAISSSIGSLQQ
ncbi:hypothetical protein VNO77_19136 [Canavalia gladiata]|uniref:Uncharacterized protein n=1 Tax=Canavalia gladiata TaxID=3824 RepID=A0AAN9QK87_CANGL